MSVSKLMEEIEPMVTMKLSDYNKFIKYMEKMEKSMSCSTSKYETVIPLLFDLFLKHKSGNGHSYLNYSSDENVATFSKATELCNTNGIKISYNTTDQKFSITNI